MPSEARAPEGFTLFGWWRSNGGIQAQVRESVVHLVDAADPKDRRLVCGRPNPTKGANIERGDQVSFSGGRRACERCFFLALSDTSHVLDIGRRQVVGGSPIRGGGSVYAVKATCSCGDTFGGTSVTSREIRSEHREHVLGVVYGGLFEVRELGERGQVYLTSTPSGVAPRIGFQWGGEAIAGRVAMMRAGESFETHHKDRPAVRYRVTRLAEGLVPRD